MAEQDPETNAVEKEPEPNQLPEEEAKLYAQYDVTAKILPFLDKHLTFRMIKFLGQVGMYNKFDIIRAELRLLQETNMIDFMVDKYEALGEEVPEELSAQRDAVVEKFTTMQAEVMPILQCLEDEEKVRMISTVKSVSDLCKEWDIGEDLVALLMKYAKFIFEMGQCEMAKTLLKHYISIIEVEGDVSSKLANANWGSLACCCILGDITHGQPRPETDQRDPSIIHFEEAVDKIMGLDEYIDKCERVPKKEVLMQRTWLLHWTLWPIFIPDSVPAPAGPQGKDILMMFTSEKSLSIISLACPHLFRYVAACLILHKRLKTTILKETVFIIDHESSNYSDPITLLLQALYMKMDFDEAQHQLKQCELVCKGDYFLHEHWPEFEENARLLIFETYCRIHQCINIDMIAEKLNMESEEAELWIVKLIQSAKLDARIDSEKNRVVMSKAPPSVYQQVIEKTKNLTFKSKMLLSNLDKGSKAGI